MVMCGFKFFSDFKEAAIVTAIEETGAIAVVGGLEGGEDLFANLESEEDKLYMYVH